MRGRPLLRPRAPTRASGRLGQRACHRDEGALLALTTFILCLTFLTFAFLFTEMEALAATSASHGEPVGAQAVLRALRERVAFDAAELVAPRDPPEQIRGDTLRELQERYRQEGLRLGYQARVMLAPVREAEAHGDSYDAWSDDGQHRYLSVFDGEDDGVIIEAPCPIEDGPATGCATGLFLTLHLAAEDWELSVPVLFAVNVGKEE